MKKTLLITSLLLYTLVLFHSISYSQTQTLIFSDDFNSIDTSKWNTCYWWGCTNAGNHELEWYQPQNISINNGILNLTARKETVNNFPYTSGMLSSVDKFSFLYGHVEIRAKTPAGQGLWPTFWLMPQDKSWPPEIDVLEQIGSQTNTNYMTLHYLNGKHHAFTPQTFTGPNFTSDFHTYGLEWQPDTLTWYIDGVQVATYTNKRYIPNKPMYINVNLAVGGDFPGSPNFTTGFPSSFQVDYIKVWQ